MANENTIKISELSSIEKIDNDDVFLVSEKISNNVFGSRKTDFLKLCDTLSGKFNVIFQEKGEYLSSTSKLSSIDNNEISNYLLKKDINGKLALSSIDDISKSEQLLSSIAISSATDDKIGGFKTGYTESGKSYAVQLNSDGKAYVNVKNNCK